MYEIPTPKCNKCAVYKCKKWVPECRSFLPLEPIKTSMLELALRKNSRGVLLTLQNLHLKIENSGTYPYFDVVEE